MWKLLKIVPLATVVIYWEYTRAMWVLVRDHLGMIVRNSQVEVLSGPICE